MNHLAAALTAYPLTKGCWLGCAAVFLAAAALDWWGSKNDDRQLKNAGLWLLRGGWLTLTVMLAYHGLRAHTLPINSPAEVLLSIGWGLTGLAGFLDLTFNHRLPTWAIATASALCLLAASFLWDPLLPHDATGKPLIAMHVGAAILAYCVLAAQALNSAAYLLQHRALGRRQFGGIYALLPALVPLDRIGSQLLGAAVWLLGLSLVIGATDWVQRDLAAPALPKLAASLIAWLAGLYVMVQCRRHRLSGAAFARASLWAFIPALIALYFSLPNIR
jgi:ABC-type uncharacterized transport system permease subunit